MLRRLFQPSPFLIVAVVICLYLVFEVIAAGGSLQGWVHRIGRTLLPVLLFMVSSDVILKMLIRRFRLIVWIEAFLFIAVIYYLIVV